MTDYIRDMVSYYLTHTPEETANKFGITLSTVDRHMRRVRQEIREYGSDLGPSMENVVKEHNPAKILIVDIETSPIKAYTWGLWKQDIRPEQIINDWFIICWSAKWLDNSTVYSECVTPSEALNSNDKRIVYPLWELLNTADIVVAHNAKKFDIPRIDTRMLLAGLKPPAPYQVLDTLYYYKKQFSISSNKLDYINKVFNLDQKIDTTGFKLWKDCLEGDQDALDKMVEYNINDVEILEQNYLKLRPWIKNHPNVSVFSEDNQNRCTACGSTDVVEITGSYSTPVNRYRVYRCNSCGAIAGRERSAIKSTKENSETLRAVAR
jgi:DNA-directed RNA polymerase subunit RPC12/RpoP